MGPKYPAVPQPWQADPEPPLEPEEEPAMTWREIRDKRAEVRAEFEKQGDA